MSENIRPTRSAVRRVAKWAGLTLWLLAVIGWELSLAQQLEYIHFGRGREGIIVDGGCIAFLWGYGDQDVDPGLRFYDFTSSVRLRYGFTWPRVEKAGTGWEMVVPFWVVLLILGIPTAFLWYRDRRPPKGHCQGCGYNLTGNVSGVCPECGEGVT